MKLTKLQRKVLLRARESRGKQISILGTIARGWRYYLIVGILSFSSGYFFWNAEMRYFSAMAIGLFVGFILRDIFWLRMSAQMWSINCEITNWNLVDELLEKDRT